MKAGEIEIVENMIIWYYRAWKTYLHNTFELRKKKIIVKILRKTSNIGFMFNINAKCG